MITKKLSVFVMFLLVAGTSTAWAKSYKIDELTVEAVVRPDGSLDVLETIRYDFKGSYKYAYRDIPTSRAGRIENIRVEDSSGLYRLGPESSDDSDSSQDSYIVEEADDSVRVTWYFKARNEKRDFRMSYTVRDVVRHHPDIAELYYQFVGDGWEKSIGQVQVVVRMMDGVPPDSLRAWAHGPLHGTVTLPGDRTVRFDVSPLPRRTFWEGRILFPATALTGVALVSQQPAREQIMAEEAAWAEDANRRREEAAKAAKRRAELVPVLLPVAILAALGGAIVWIFLFLRYGRPYRKQRTPVPGEQPSSHPPALVDYLLHRSVTGTAVIATLIDLARRGYLGIREKASEKVGWFGVSKKPDYRFERTNKPVANLQGYERELLEFVFKKAGDGHGFWMSEFKKVAGKNKSDFLKWFKAWRKQIEKLGKEEKFFEPYHLRPILLNIVCGVAIAVLGAVICFMTNSPTGLPAIAVGIIQAVLSGLLTRRTKNGQQLHAAWIDFKKHIKSISKSRGPVSLTSEDWGSYIVAAILFGLHQKLGKVLDLSTGGQAHPVIPWYSAGHSSTANFSGLGSGISSMVTSASSTMSSASGMGGGASGGGGGGAGGGGGGAG